MLQRLARNTLITALAFAITGVVPVLLVPMLVHAWGVADYGLIVLLRLLLPTGALAVFDPGIGETASFAVAKARHDGDWVRCGRFLGGLVALACVIGIVATALLVAAVPVLLKLFAVPAWSQAGFAGVVIATAAAFAPIVVGLVGDGVLKGFEDFKRLRTIEVASTFLYAAAAVVAIHAGLGYAWAGYAFVGASVLRAAAVVALATSKLRARGTSFALPRIDERRELKRRCMPLAANRTIGVVQGYAAPVLIGALLGPAAVGFFDLVVRIPRFLKVVTGILNSAVLPVVMRLDQADDADGVRRVMRVGLLVVVAITAPTIAWAMCFSETILRLWVNAAFAQLWHWQAAMFVWPFVNALTSFACGALLGRPRFVSLLNWIVLGQIVVLIGASLALLPIFHEQAFVVGQISAVVLSLPLQLWLVARDCGLSSRDFKRHASCTLVFFAAAAIGIALDAHAHVHDARQLVGSLIAWCLTSLLVIWTFVLDRAERASAIAALRHRFARRARPS